MVTVKVISLNLWSGGKLLPAILDFLRSEDADLVALQEVYNAADPALEDRFRSIEVLKRKLDYPHIDFAQAYVESLDGQLLPHGNTVLSKLAINSRRAVHMTPVERNYYLDIPDHWPVLPAMLQHVRLDSEVGELNLFNMHGVWDMDGNNYSGRRRQMSDSLLAETAGRPNVVLAGDSNAKPTNRAMRNLEKQLKPVFGNELTSTFNMRRKDNPGYATAAVDLMYTSPEIKVIAKACPDVDISDHRPLVVTLEIGEPKGYN